MLRNTSAQGGCVLGSAKAHVVLHHKPDKSFGASDGNPLVQTGSNKLQSRSLVLSVIQDRCVIYMCTSHSLTALDNAAIRNGRPVTAFEYFLAKFTRDNILQAPSHQWLDRYFALF